MKYTGLGMNNEIKIVFEFQVSAMLTDRFPVHITCPVCYSL